MSSLHEPGGRTPLHLAAASGQSAIVSLLLAADAPHSAEDWQGATPFQMACRRGHHAVAAQISSWATRCGGGASEVPTEQELRGFELVEGMAVRERARRRRCIDGRPLLQTPFTLDGLLSDDGCRSLIAAAEGVAYTRQYPLRASPCGSADSSPSSITWRAGISGREMNSEMRLIPVTVCANMDSARGSCEE